jgi:hypothetical protein
MSERRADTSGLGPLVGINVEGGISATLFTAQSELRPLLPADGGTKVGLDP